MKTILVNPLDLNKGDTIKKSDGSLYTIGRESVKTSFFGTLATGS